MPRHKDENWNLPAGTPSPTGGNTHSWDSIHAALLMDIRDELKRMNNVLQCPNFIEVPSILRSIKRNTTKKRKPKIAARPRLRAVS